MITSKHLNSVGVELSRIEELMAALEMTSAGLKRGEDHFERQGYDGTMGVIAALHGQVQKTIAALEDLFPIVHEAEK